MKAKATRLLLLAFPVAGLLTLTSCTSFPSQTRREYDPTEKEYTTYVSLPAGYSGDAYYYNNRYYAGGRYEEGPYSYGGRTYAHRYYHNGQYLYGGEYRPSASRAYTGRTYQRSTPVYRKTVRGMVY